MNLKTFVLLSFFIILIASPSFPREDSSGICPLEKQLISQGLVNIQDLDPSIQVKLMYSTTNNFLHKDVYGSLTNCYLQPKIARMAVKAQKTLKSIEPQYSLIILDGVRPNSVQWTMWALVKGTSQQGYVANPKTGSVHNYGCAIDLSIVDESGKELDMGTEFDSFEKLAQPRHEKYFLKKGRLTVQQIENRKLLRKVMTKAGFTGIKNEWWHFNGVSKKEMKRLYKIVK